MSSLSMSSGNPNSDRALSIGPSSQTESGLCPQNEDHFLRLGKYAAELWQSKALTDVIIVVQNREFKAHKAVLACHSPYFSETLIKPGFSDVHCLQLSSVTSRAFAILLNYMYTSELEVSCRDLGEVFRAARKLGINGAVKKCVELLYGSTNRIENMVYLYVTARKMDIRDSAVRAFRMMVTHFEHIMVTPEFLDLEKDHIIELLSSDELGTRGEVVVFLAALKWIDHNFMEREEYVEDVLSKIRFGLMSLDEIISCFHPPILPGIIKIPSINIMLLNANCYISAKQIGRECVFPELAPKPRTFLITGETMELWDTSVFEAGMGDTSKRKRASVVIQALYRGYKARKQFDLKRRKSHRAASVIQAVFRDHMVRKRSEKANDNLDDGSENCESLPSPSREIMEEHESAIKSEEHESAIKSEEHESPIKSEEPESAIKSEELESAIKSEEPESAIKSEEPESAIKSEGHESAISSEEHESATDKKSTEIYVLGTHSGKEDENEYVIYKFDTISQDWEMITKTIVSSQESRLVSTSKYLYIIGGVEHDKNNTGNEMTPLKECYRYEFSSYQWNPAPSLYSGRSYHAAVTLYESVLAIGGRNEEEKIMSSIEELKPESTSWSTFVKDLPEPIMCMGVAVQGDSVWVVGGFTNFAGHNAITNKVWCFNGRTDEWSERKSLPVPLAFVTLLADRNCLYCIGGATTRYDEDGKTDLESVEQVYLNQNDDWVPLKPMPVPCHSVVATVSEGNIFILGGFCTQAMCQIKNLFYYKKNEQNWFPLCSTPIRISNILNATANQ